MTILTYTYTYIRAQLQGLVVNSEIDVRPFLHLSHSLVSSKTVLDGGVGTAHSWPFEFSVPDTLAFGAGVDTYEGSGAYPS